MTDSGATVEVLGVRHHGPGSARAVVRRLEQLQPDAVVIEGPADADPLAGLAGDETMVPPVALLAYAADDPSVSALWPLAVFSPEWQALRWAVSHAVPVRFGDLPAAVWLAAPEPATEAADVPVPEARPTDPVRHDPLAQLAAAAGYDDPERWWDDVVEARRDPDGCRDEAALFELIADAMAELRAARPDQDVTEQRREAQMRQVIRATVKAGHHRVAVVCGAWHAPALRTPLPPAAPDARVLRGLPKRKASLTWIPWTHSRLSYASGYGAGIGSPGWYAHLFATTDTTVADWLTRVAGVLRREDLPVSTAHVIEATRLAEALATLRGRPLAGLAEVTEATRAVLCEGNDVTLDLVTRRLVVGEALGAVPRTTPTVPLEQDLAATCRRLRFKRDPVPATKDLDLRKSVDADRSRLLHRLRLLGISWGQPARSEVRGLGTFRETWSLTWRPELAVDVVEAAVWGTTVAGAAAAKVRSDALAATLPDLTVLVEQSLMADLPEALTDLLAALDARAARDHDVDQLMAALPPLVRSLRYGDVRGTDLGALDTVVDALVLRICAGLPAVVGHLDDDRAGEVVGHVDRVHAAVALRDDDRSRTAWLDLLASLVDRADAPGLLLGRVTRLLLDGGRLDPSGAGDRLARALSVGAAPTAKAAWVEGFLAGSGLLLVHDPTLLRVVDEWVAGLDREDFTEVVPLLRRTFGAMPSGERRAIGERVRQVDSAVGRAGTIGGHVEEYDVARAAAALATTMRLLGIGESR